MYTESLAEKCLARAKTLNQDDKGKTETRDSLWGLPPEKLMALVDTAVHILENSTSPPQEAEIDGILQEVYAIRTLLDATYPGHNEAWEKWRTIFVRMALARGLNYDDAEDLAQITCLRAQQSALNNFRFESSSKTYLLNVFSNCFLDYKRKQRRRNVHESPHSLDGLPESGDGAPDTNSEPTDSAPSPEQNAIDLANAEIMQLLYDEVKRILRSDHFEVFRLYYIEIMYIDPRTSKSRKWTAEAISERLGKPVDTVSSILKRMPEKLRNNPRIMQMAADHRSTGLQEYTQNIPPLSAPKL